MSKSKIRCQRTWRRHKWNRETGVCDRCGEHRNAKAKPFKDNKERHG